MKTHDLKIDKEHLDAILEGRKTCEIRKNDRGYQVGDTLLLTQFPYSETGFTDTYNVTITHIDTYAQQDDYVVLSFCAGESELIRQDFTK